MSFLDYLNRPKLLLLDSDPSSLPSLNHQQPSILTLVLDNLPNQLPNSIAHLNLNQPQLSPKASCCLKMGSLIHIIMAISFLIMSLATQSAANSTNFFFAPGSNSLSDDKEVMDPVIRDDSSLVLYKVTNNPLYCGPVLVSDATSGFISITGSWRLPELHIRNRTALGYNTAADSSQHMGQGVGMTGQADGGKANCTSLVQAGTESTVSFTSLSELCQPLVTVYPLLYLGIGGGKEHTDRSFLSCYHYHLSRVSF